MRMRKLINFGINRRNQESNYFVIFSINSKTGIWHSNNLRFFQFVITFLNIDIGIHIEIGEIIDRIKSLFRKKGEIQTPNFIDDEKNDEIRDELSEKVLYPLNRSNATHDF